MKILEYSTGRLNHLPKITQFRSHASNSKIWIPNPHSQLLFSENIRSTSIWLCTVGQVTEFLNFSIFLSLIYLPQKVVESEK